MPRFSTACEEVASSCVKMLTAIVTLYKMNSYEGRSQGGGGNRYQCIVRLPPPRWPPTRLSGVTIEIFSRHIQSFLQPNALFWSVGAPTRTNHPSWAPAGADRGPRAITIRTPLETMGPWSPCTAEPLGHMHRLGKSLLPLWLLLTHSRSYEQLKIPHEQHPLEKCLWTRCAAVLKISWPFGVTTARPGTRLNSNDNCTMILREPIAERPKQKISAFEH